MQKPALAFSVALGLLVAGLLPPSGAQAQGRATITVTRPGELYAALASVDVELNGVRVGKLESGGTFKAAIPPGNTTVGVSIWSSPGRYKISFKAVPGRRYAFVVTPRSEQMVAGLLGGLAGMMIDTAVNENSGSFKITPAR
ncbi:MAG TPA: hypothetical protein VK522_10400 [Pseudolabrys sp.]|nr:hypothetical protein [Pseudolabrys sp.]